MVIIIKFNPLIKVKIKKDIIKIITVVTIIIVIIMGIIINVDDFKNELNMVIIWINIIILNYKIW